MLTWRVVRKFAAFWTPRRRRMDISVCAKRRINGTARQHRPTD